MSSLLNKRLFLTLAFSTVLLVVGSQTAYAQYWGLGSNYGYYGLGSSLLWPLFYLGNRSINSSLTYPYQPYNGNYYNPNTNFYNNTYGYRLSPPGNYSNQQAQSQINNPNDVFNTGATNQPNGLPPAAPSRQTINQTGNLPQNPAALNGFFQTVNVRYRSDLAKALRQPDMHGWAESIGLVAGNQTLPINLSKARANEISAVLKDNSLDPNKKLDILRLLIQ